MARGENKGKAKARAVDIIRQKRMELALKFRIEGTSFREIARRVKAESRSESGPYRGVCSAAYSECAAHNDVLSEIRRLAESCSEKAEEVQRIELERLDKLLAGMWKRAERGDEGAVNAILRIMDRRARYLGIDAPTKVAPTDPSGDKPYEPLTDKERVFRVAAILDAARTRAAGQAAAGPDEKQGGSHASPHGDAP